MPSETILKAVYTDTLPAFWKTNTRPSNTLLTAHQDIDDDEGLSFHLKKCSWVTLVTVLVKSRIWRRGSHSS
ncbi:hypothetical protein BT69DRAFT_1279137 [Atractiella rhizophila]|nr:hypothetical protein BT69DRAFT_1279137 [Atractiella rhizophila]